MSAFTEIRVHPIEKDSLRALVTCQAGGVIWLTGIRVIEGSKGLFVSMPARKSAEGEFQDVFFPVSRAVREELTSAVLNAYYAKVGGGTTDTAGVPEPDRPAAPGRPAPPPRTPSATR